MATEEEAPYWQLRKSSIHNRGMFAARDIPEGERIIQYVGEMISKKESTRRALEWEEKARKQGDGLVYIFDLNKKYDLDGNLPNNPAKYINHTCDPNCEAVNYDTAPDDVSEKVIHDYNEIWIVALRDIKAGEELGFDYGYDIQHFMDHPCRCGSDNCVGYIVSREYWPKLKKLLRKKKKLAKKYGKKSDDPAVTKPPKDKKTKKKKRKAGKTRKHKD